MEKINEIISAQVKVQNQHKKLIESEVKIEKDYFTGMLEIPYWIEGEVPTRPIDIWGKAGSVPNGFVTGAACTAIELCVEDLSNKKIQTKKLLTGKSKLNRK